MRIQSGYNQGTIRIRSGYDDRSGYDQDTIRIRSGYDQDTIRI